MDRHVKVTNGNQVIIDSIDTLSRQNARDHHTHKFDRVYCDDGLTIRRGQQFEIILHFNKKFDRKTNTLRFVFTTGDDPRPGAGTHVDFCLSKELKQNEWSAVVAEKRTKADYFITLTSPSNCIVSHWQFVVEVITNTTKGQEVTSVYAHPTLVYILFNPWCRDDDVYFPDTHLLKEYVLNDSGVIFHGNKNQIGAKPWFFGQFETGILDICIWCLRRGFKDKIAKAMADPVRVSRIISKIVNSFDDNGILTGRWDSEYIDGVSPLKWSDSVRILRQYARTSKSVKYGQCFVFSGIVTTICRALGLPCRSVTNFSSAHDSDGSITVDVYWDLQRHQAVEGVGVRDSVWNFHCWNDVWMKRNDLTDGYGGWQVVDSTPQERSDGMYQCGPMSVAAIKEGKCEMLYDGPYVFAEVNADKVNWGQDGGQWFVLSLDKSSIGRKISTKVPDGLPVKPCMTDVAPIRQDITDEYKYKDESDRERLAVINASRSALKTRPVYSRGFQDVIFRGFEQQDNILIGKEFSITVTFQNVGDRVRTIKGRLLCEAVSYTGIKQQTIKEHSFEVPLEPKTEDMTTMKVSLIEYLPHITEQMGMKVSAILRVVETGHVHTFQDDFRLRKPDIHIEVLDDKNIRVGESFKCRLSFSNPLSATLSKCCLTIDGPGLDNEEQFELGNIGGNQEWVAFLQLTPRKPGRRQITSSLDTHQIQNMVGVVEVKVFP